MSHDDRLVFHRWYQLALVLTSLIGVLVVVLATSRYGPGLSPDSAAYISAARHIAAGKGTVLYDNAPLFVHPPLYPALLAGVSYFFGRDPIAVASYINAFLFGVIIYLSGLVFFTFLMPNLLLAIVGMLSILAGYPLVQVSLHAWSEPLFITFVLLYINLTIRYCQSGDKTSLMLLSLSVALACLTRYIGVVFILTGMGSMLFFGGRNRKIRFKHALVFACITILPLATWVIRNYLLSGTLFGPRAPSSHTLFQNLALLVESVLSWYIPWRFLVRSHIVDLLAAIPIALLVAVAAKQSGAKMKAWAPLWLPFGTYVVSLVLFSTIAEFDPIGTRLLAPVFVPANVMFLLLAPATLTRLAKRWLSEKRIKMILVAGLALWLVYLAGVTAYSVARAMRQGLGYNSESWKKSQTVRYVLQNPAMLSGRLVYSNGPDALYILANVESKWSPQKTTYNSGRVKGDIAGLRGTWPEEDNSYLVWFDGIQREYLFTVDELRAIAALHEIARLDDGAIYSIARN